MILHGYFRSGTSYRTRIALNLKGLTYEQVGVDLRVGAQKSEAFLRLNPQGLVPALEVDGHILTQSPAILEWLEETHPEPALLPKDAAARAVVRAMAAVIGCDIHPLNNLRVLKTLRAKGADQVEVDAWAQTWIHEGFVGLDAMVAQHGAGWCFGDRPGLVDCYLIPQVYSAQRFNVDLAPYPHLLAVQAAAQVHPAFMQAHPDQQPDADT